MSAGYHPADGKIVSGRGEGDYVYCFNDTFPIRLKYDRLDFKDSILFGSGWHGSDGTYLWNGPAESKVYFEKNKKDTFNPLTVARIEILASTTTGPSASNFVKGTLLAGVAVGAAAAMTTMGSQHTVKVTWRDDVGSKESIISFNNSTGFQNFIGKLGSLLNQPNEATPAISSPATSSADEILKFKKLMDEGIITQAEFDAKKKQLLGLENAVINSSEANDPEYYSVILTNYHDWKFAAIKTYMKYRSCDMSVAEQIVESAPFEIMGTTSKSEAEEVAKMFSSAGSTVEIKQPKSDGSFVVTTFKSKYETDEDQPKAEAIDLEAKYKDPEVGDISVSKLFENPGDYKDSDKIREDIKKTIAIKEEKKSTVKFVILFMLFIVIPLMVVMFSLMNCAGCL